MHCTRDAPRIILNISLVAFIRQASTRFRKAKVKVAKLIFSPKLGQNRSYSKFWGKKFLCFAFKICTIIANGRLVQNFWATLRVSRKFASIVSPLSMYNSHICIFMNKFANFYKNQIIFTISKVQKAFIFTKPRASLAYTHNQCLGHRMIRGASSLNIGMWLHQIYF